MFTTLIQDGTFRIVVCFLLTLIPHYATAAAKTDSFEGQVVVEWLVEEGRDRDMRLLEEFTFIDQAGKRWKVPKGTVIDGASIPRLFWTMIGPPFVGKYRRASVVHDYYCVVRTEPWQAVHRMFYEASRSAGVAVIKAKIMYAALRAAGPRWPPTSIKGIGRIEEGAEFLAARLEQVFSAKSANDLEKWIQTENPSLDELDARVEQYFEAKEPMFQN